MSEISLDLLSNMDGEGVSLCAPYFLSDGYSAACKCIDTQLLLESDCSDTPILPDIMP